MDRRIGFAETVGGTNTFYYYLTDHVGTVLQIVKEDGTVVNQYDYDAFGRVRSRTEDLENRYLFQGREWDKNGGFYYFRNRIYLPERGEFATPDMNLGRGILGEMDGMATLTFCGGDPVNMVDPTGLWAWDNDWAQPLFMASFWSGCGKTSVNIGVRTVKGIKESALIGSDMMGYGASAAFGWGDSYEGRSKLFQTLYDDPTALGSTDEVRKKILVGTAKEIANIASLGAYKMAESHGQAWATGDWDTAQDRSLQALLLTFSAKSMQAKGINPYKTYTPGQYNNAMSQPIIRQRVLANIAESQKARSSSSFAEVSRRWTASEFYEKTGWSTAKIADHLKGIDFSKPVQEVRLSAGTRLIQYQLDGASKGNYFAKPDTPSYGLGIYTSGLKPNSYVLNSSVLSLRSTAADISIDWFADLPWKIDAPGGKLQFFIIDKAAAVSVP
jgi:RHS repeat-associated protein